MLLVPSALLAGAALVVALAGGLIGRRLFHEHHPDRWAVTILFALLAGGLLLIAGAFL